MVGGCGFTFLVLLAAFFQARREHQEKTLSQFESDSQEFARQSSFEEDSPKPSPRAGDHDDDDGMFVSVDNPMDSVASNPMSRFS